MSQKFDSFCAIIVTVPNLVKLKQKATRPDPVSKVACRLGKQRRQIQPTRQVITSVGNQSAHIESRLLTFAATH